jgi:hypothetical protein
MKIALNVGGNNFLVFPLASGALLEQIQQGQIFTREGYGSDAKFKGTTDNISMEVISDACLIPFNGREAQLMEQIDAANKNGSYWYSRYAEVEKKRAVAEATLAQIKAAGEAQITPRAASELL